MRFGRDDATTKHARPEGTLQQLAERAHPASPAGPNRHTGQLIKQRQTTYADGFAVDVQFTFGYDTADSPRHGTKGQTARG